MSMKNTIRGGLVVATTAGVAFAGVAWAQSPADDPTTPEADQEQQRAGKRHHRGHRGGAVIAQTAELTGLTPQEIVTQLDDGASIDQVAQANGSSGDEVVAAVTEQISGKLAGGVDAGRITQEMADARLAEATERLTEAVTTENPAEARREARLAAREARQQALADVLGLTVDELQALHGDGQSLGDIAEGQGVDVDEVVDVLVAPLAERLDEAVAGSLITQERADERLANAEERIEYRIENGPRRPGPGEDASSA